MTASVSTSRTSTPAGQLPLDDATRRRTIIWLVARLGIATVVLIGATAAIDARYTFTQQALFAIAFTLYASSTMGVVALARSSHAAAAMLVGIDLIIVTVLVWLTGSAASAFSFLYGLLALAGALVLGPRASVRVAAVGIVLFLGLTWGVAAGYVSPPRDQAASAYSLTAAELATFALSTVLGISLVAALAANLATRVQTTGGQLAAAERRVAGLEQRNDDIVRSIASGLLTTTETGMIISANPAATAVFGGSLDDIAGRPITDFIAATDVDTEISATESIGSRLDGTQFPVGFRRSPLVDAEGEADGWVWAFQDLTEINRLRAEAVEAQRLAQLGRLAAGLAHEIRNPLTGIAGSVELVRSGGDMSEDDDRLLAIVQKETDRLNSLVETMLRVGRPSIPSPVDIELRTLAAEVVQMAQHESEALQIRLELSEDDGAEPVYAQVDPDQIRQVLWNLIRNALQASSEGQRVVLSVSATEEHAVLQVRDFGTGISEDIREHLFEMFYTGRSQGIGLGLALVQQIVRDHSGKVTATNADDERGGAIFVVELPRHFTAPAL